MKHSDSAHERLLRASLLPPEQVSSAMGLPEGGVRYDQTEELRENYGENLVATDRKDTILYRLRRAFVNPFSIILFILACISFVTGVIFDSDLALSGASSAILMVILIISGVIRFVQEIQARHVTDELVDMVHTTVQVRRDGKWNAMPSDELVVGDLVRLDPGDRVPADIRITGAEDFFVNQSMITGQSDILERTPDPLESPPDDLEDYKNTVFLGSVVTGGYADGIVLAVGSDTVYGGITPRMADRKKGFDRGEKGISLVLIKFMAVLVPIIFLVVGLTKGNWLNALLFALSVTVGLTPELLPMVVTACLTRGSSQMGRKQTIVKSINAMQGFGAMDVLCVDKTGTLTGATVQLEYYIDVMGNESSEVLDCAFLNSAYHSGLSNHLDAAILKSREMNGREPRSTRLLEKYEELDELPFDYTRRFASVLIRGDEGNILIAKGSVDEVALRCARFRYKNDLYDIGPDGMRSVHAIVDEMQEDGMKVLAIAAKRLGSDTLSPEDEYEMTLLGYVAFFDPPKQSAAEALQRLRELNINVKVLTGDHGDVASSVCGRLGIPFGRVITGRELDSCSDSDLIPLAENENVFAELSPKQKVRVVKAVQSGGHTVGFLGDGMNDLPAVVQAEVGISVDTAAEAVSDNADVILLKKDLNVLNDGVLEGRKAFANMSKYVKITASSNFGHVFSIVIASLLLPFLPTTAVQLLLLNFLYDVLCLVLPWDRVDESRTAKPLEWSGRTLGRFMICFGPISSIFDFITFAFLFFGLCPAVCGGSFGALDPSGQAAFITLFQTGWFLESMWTQVLVLHLLRTEHIPVIQSRSSLPVALVTILGVLICTVLAVSPLGSPLGLTSLPAVFYPFLILVVALYLLSVLLVKKLYIGRYRELI